MGVKRRTPVRGVEVDKEGLVGAYIDWWLKRGIWWNFRITHGLFKEYQESEELLMSGAFGKEPSAETVREAFGYLYVEELEFIKGIFKEEDLDGPVGRVISVANIGAGPGTSGLGWIESNPRVILLTIDIHKESNPFGCLDGERAAFNAANHMDLAGRRWFQAHGPSIEVGKALQSGEDGANVIWTQGNPWNPPTVGTQGVIYRHGEPPTFDLVFVDGRHDFEYAFGDMETYDPMLKKGGLMLCHDYLKASHPYDPRPGWKDSGVDLAVAKFMDENEDRYEQKNTVGAMAVLRKLL